MSFSPFKGGINTVEKTIVKQSIDLNDPNTKVIVDYLNQSKFKGLIIRGTIGCGKTTLITKCVEALDYIIINYDEEQDFDVFLSELCCKGINKFLSTNKKVYVIEDVDDVLKSTEKTELFKYLDKNKCLPVIMTSNNKAVGVVREVPKFIINHVFVNNNQQIANLNYDYRFLKNSAISVGTKDIELDTFQTIDFCLNKNDFKEKIRKCTLYTCLTVYYNYPNMTSSLNNCVKIIDLCCMSDYILSEAYSNQDWDLYDAVNILGTIYPLIYFDHPKKMLYPNQYSIPSGNFKELEMEAYSYIINKDPNVSDKAKKLAKIKGLYK